MPKKLTSEEIQEFMDRHESKGLDSWQREFIAEEVAKMRPVIRHMMGHVFRDLTRLLGAIGIPEKT